MKRSLSLFWMTLIALIAATAGWYAGRSRTTMGTTETTPSARKVLYYQSGMHPWIRSDKPGKCTICGMPLTPVYEGDKSAEAAAGVVALSPNSISVLQVRTARVQKRVLERSVRVAGIIDDDDTQHRRLSAYIEGRIEKLNVDHVGATVTEGQPLATFHSPMLLALEREYVGVVRQLAGASPAVRTDLEHLRSSAENRLRLMGLTSKQIEAMPQRKDTEHLFEILAPLSGTVVSREVYEGQYVKEGDKLFEIADFATMWFQFDAYERDLPWLRVGQFVDVTTPSVPGKTFRASIRFINPNLNELTRTVKVRVEIPNPWIQEGGTQRRELLHRIYADGVVRAQLGEVLSIARSAVLNPTGKPVVYVSLGEGHYQARNVSLGRSTDDFYEVLSGLNPDEDVVTSGNLLIDAQAQIQMGADSAAPSDSPSTNALSATPVSPPGTNGAASFLDFLKHFDRVRKTLALDDLESFRTEMAALPQAVSAFAETTGKRADWKQWTDKLSQSSMTGAPATLPEARKAFHQLNQQVVNVTRSLTTASNLPTLKFYQCPMASRAFPGAPKSAVWFQFEAPLENPYMGKEMIDCGTEVKP